MKSLPVLALLLLSFGNASQAERTPPRALPLAESGSARVIVKFRSEAATLREHSLGAPGNRSIALAAIEQRANALGARAGLRLHGSAALGDRVQLVQADGIDSHSLAARLARDADVEYAEPDRRARRSRVPNDPRFASVGGSGPAVGQWYLKAPAGEVTSSIDAVSAWDITTGSTSIVVAVLDTGVRFSHPDLAGKLLPGYDLVNDSAISNDGNGRDSDASDPGDWTTDAEANDPNGPFYRCGPLNPTTGRYLAEASSWHGTQVAGIVGAATDNGVGMAGAGWNVRVLPVRVLGKCFGNTSDIAAGIRWAAGLSVPGLPINPNPARVINLSLGSVGACSTTEREAIAAANAAGAVVVVAAGNSAGLKANSPANCPGAIGVAALRHVGSKVGFSDVGSELAIAAPGGNCVNLSGPCLYPILTTIDSGATGPVSSTYTDSLDASVGTSFSSPLVAATAALMLSAQPALTPAAVKASMQASARPFPSSGVADDDSGPIVACRAPSAVEQLQCYCTRATCGAGMLDAGAAVLAATGVRAAIEATPAAPVAGELVSLSAAGSTAASGRTIVAWQWSLVEAAGVASGFSASTNAQTTSVRPDRAGTFTVHLLVTDDAGAGFGTQQTLTVSAMPVPPPPPPPAASGSSGGGGGGGAASWPWLLGLAGACLALLRRRRRND